jgi:hypothetical protein
MSTDSLTRHVRIKKIDADKRIVYGEVFAPGVIDSSGEIILKDDIELMAHRFMRLDLNTVIDTNHDNIPNGSYPIESFIARKGDADYIEGAWVLGVKIEDSRIWNDVKEGRLNGYSFQAMVKKVDMVAKLAVIRDNVGRTENAQDHNHLFFVQLDDKGRVKGGCTSETEGHFHSIRRGTATEEAEGHSHRYFI